MSLYRGSCSLALNVVNFTFHLISVVFSQYRKSLKKQPNKQKIASKVGAKRTNKIQVSFMIEVYDRGGMYEEL